MMHDLYCFYDNFVPNRENGFMGICPKYVEGQK